MLTELTQLLERLAAQVLRVIDDDHGAIGRLQPRREVLDRPDRVELPRPRDRRTEVFNSLTDKVFSLIEERA